MPPLELAHVHQRRRRRIAARIEAAAIAAWRRVDAGDVRSSWSAAMPSMLAALIAGQLAAAVQADGYVAEMAGEFGIDATPAGRLNPEAFTGAASDGRPLTSLLMTPVFHTLRTIGQGGTIREAMTSGQAALRLLTRTEVADAGRTADGVAIAAREPLGWVRMVNPPCCARCAILAGKFFRYSSGFQRHPGCDCTHIPAPENVAGDLRTDPLRLLKEGQIRGLSKADTKAIVKDGADMNRVVNAHRGMYTAAGNRKLTTELSRVGQQRLRPETIYREAASREDSVRLLRLHGYLA